MQAFTPVTATWIVAIPLIAWRLYARVRRVIGRQHFTAVRPRITLTLFPLLILVLSFAVRTQPGPLGGMAGGLLVGALLGFYGLRRTRFEVTPQGLYYTPNAHLGIALSLVFFTRLVWRMIELNTTGAGGLNSIHSSPLTLAVFGLLAGYYMTYAIGLLRWHAGVPALASERAVIQ